MTSAFLRNVGDEDECWIVCAKGDPGAVQFSPTLCEKCAAPTANSENEYGEFVCDDCQQNAAEAAYERYCEDFHDGGCTRFNSLRDQQIEAMKLK